MNIVKIYILTITNYNFNNKLTIPLRIFLTKKNRKRMFFGFSCELLQILDQAAIKTQYAEACRLFSLISKKSCLWLEICQYISD